MSDELKKLLNKATNQVACADIFTPYEVPAPLWELTPKIIKQLASMASSYGFPYINNDNYFQRLYLKTDGSRRIQLSIMEPPVFMMAVGDIANDCYFIMVRCSNSLGLLVWDKKISVAEVVRAMNDTDNEMLQRGLFDAESKQRQCALKYDGKFKVAEMFPDKFETYEMNPNWKESAVLSLFDEPKKLLFKKVGSRTYLCLASHAKKMPWHNAMSGLGSPHGTKAAIEQSIVDQHTAKCGS